MKIAVIGLGYIGLPLSLQFARSGVEVLGIDIDPQKVEQLNRGESYIKKIGEVTLKQEVENGHFMATTDFSVIKDVEAVIICVPTPLTKNREPDLSFVLSTAESIAPYLKSGSLVALESTTYPGTTEDELRETLEQKSGLKAGEDFYLVYTAEREDPGNSNSRVRKIPKVIGGFTSACLEKGATLYSKAIETLVPVSSCRVAEATKLTENIFRAVNIALVNELKIIFDKMGIDIWEVIEAAKTKPFGYMPFYPGPGWGGHCIPIDPFYLTWKAREFGKHTRFIELAGEINTAMPSYVVNRVGEALNANKKAINGSKILIIGLAYKPDVDDDRESPSYELLERLGAKGAKLRYYDPYLPIIPQTRRHPQLTGHESIAWSREEILAFDCVVIATAHSAIDYPSLAEWAQLIVDTRNVIKTDSKNYYKA